MSRTDVGPVVVGVQGQRQQRPAGVVAPGRHAHAAIVRGRPPAGTGRAGWLYGAAAEVVDSAAKAVTEWPAPIAR